MNLAKVVAMMMALGTPLTLPAKVIETSRIADAIPLIDQDTWFLVDLDNTLYQCKHALGHTLWFYDELDKLMTTGHSRDDAIKHLYPLWMRAQQCSDMEPLEASFISAIADLQDRGVVVMGFTHRQPMVAETTLRQLESLGVDFTRTAPSLDTFTIAARYPSLYTHGVLFVSDYNKKGDVFTRFLEALQKKPKRIVFIDDKRKNVDELDITMKNEGIDYVGIHYTAIDYARPIYDRDIAAYQLRHMDRVLSNEAAALLIQHGVE